MAMYDELMNLSHEILYDVGKISVLANLVMETEQKQKVWVPLSFINETATRIKETNDRIERIIMQLDETGKLGNIKR